MESRRVRGRQCPGLKFSYGELDVVRNAGIPNPACGYVALVSKSQYTEPWFCRPCSIIFHFECRAMLETYGVEAARETIIQEIIRVFSVYGIKINHRVLSLVADYMTFEGEVKGMNRQDMRSNTSPFHKMSFETTMEFLRTATIHGHADRLSSNSARIVLGLPAGGGTGSFDVAARLKNLGDVRS